MLCSSGLFLLFNKMSYNGTMEAKGVSEQIQSITISNLKAVHISKEHLAEIHSRTYGYNSFDSFPLSPNGNHSFKITQNSNWCKVMSCDLNVKLYTAMSIEIFASLPKWSPKSNIVIFTKLVQWMVQRTKKAPDTSPSWVRQWKWRFASYWCFCVTDKKCLLFQTSDITCRTCSAVRHFHAKRMERCSRHNVKSLGALRDVDNAVWVMKASSLFQTCVRCHNYSLSGLWCQNSTTLIVAESTWYCEVNLFVVTQHYCVKTITFDKPP